MLDVEFADIRAMVKPGSQRRLDAKARLRAIAVLENLFEGKKSQPSDQQLDSALTKLSDGREWRAIFPGVATLTIDPDAEGPGLAIKISRNRGEEVRLAPEGTPGAAVMAVKRVNELDYYSLGMRDLERKLGLCQAKILQLIRRDGLQEDPEYFKIIKSLTRNESRNIVRLPSFPRKREPRDQRRRGRSGPPLSRGRRIT